jgi:hypothetical protein
LASINFGRSKNVDTVLHNLKSRTAKTIGQWALVTVLLMIALIQGNVLPYFIAATCLTLWIVTVIGVLTWHYVGKTGEQRRIEDEEGRRYRYSSGDKPFFSSKGEYFIFAGVWVLLLIATSFTFLRIDMVMEGGGFSTSTPYAVIERTFGDEVVIGEGTRFTLYVPLLDDVHNYNDRYNIMYECTANTKDGGKVIASVSAETKVPVGQVLSVHRFHGGQYELQRVAEEKLCDRFGRVVAAYVLADMPSNLVLEHHTGDDAAAMKSVGLQYDGVLAISDVQPS